MLGVETQRHSFVGSQLQTIASALRVAEQDEVDFHNGDNDKEELDTSKNDEEDQEEIASEEYDDEASDPDGVEEDREDSEPDEEDAEEDEDESEEYEEYVRKFEVKVKDGGAISDEWFRGYGDKAHFDFEKLDRVGIPSYEPPKDGITYEPNQK